MESWSIPSLDLVIYKMAGSDQQYNPALTGIPQNYEYDGSRDNWKPAARASSAMGRSVPTTVCGA